MVKPISIIGHQEIINYFDQVISADHLANCYLFYGPTHVGKTAVLGQLVQKLIGDVADVNLEQPEILASRYPNFYYLKVQEDKSEISVDDVRDFRSRLSLGALGKGRKIAVIFQGEALNSSSSNALLKLLEEPTQNTTIFILSNRGDSIMPTIRSRAVSIEFHPVPVSVQLRQLSQYGKSDDLENIVKAASGKPGLALSYLNNRPEFDTMIGRSNELVDVLLMGNDQLITFFSNQDITEDFYDHLMMVLRDLMLVGAGVDEAVNISPLLPKYRQLISGNQASRLANLLSAVEKLRSSPLYLNQELQLDNTFINI